MPGALPPGMSVAGAASGSFGLGACLAEGHAAGAEAAAECGSTCPSGGAPKAEDPAAVFRQKVLAFRPSFNAALAQARDNNPELAEELDGLFAQMFDEAKARDFDKALQTLDELTELVNSAPTDSGADQEDEEQQEEGRLRLDEVRILITA